MTPSYIDAFDAFASTGVPVDQRKVAIIAAYIARPSGPRRRKRRVELPERGPIGKAAAILGLPLRTVQDQSARGEIPGAAKIGGRWTYDIETLRRHVKQRERETWQSGKRRPRMLLAG